MATLAEIKRHNKRAGRFFFDKGNPPVVAKYGNYLVTGSVSKGEFAIYKYDAKTGHINFVDNPNGSYSWQPYPTTLHGYTR